jgi:hypothetical protein
VGVYLGGRAPINSVFREIADAGVDVVWIGTNNYRQMIGASDTEQTSGEKPVSGMLHRLARNYGIGIYVQLFASLDRRPPLEAEKGRIKETVILIDSQPHSEVVVGYGLQDEVEMRFRPGESAEMDDYMRRFTRLVKRTDPRRTTMINHFGSRWGRFDEDEIWASIFYCIPESAAQIDLRIDEARRAGHSEFVLVAAAQSLSQINAAKKTRSLWMTHLAPDSVSQRTPRQDVRDYLLAAYDKGGAGCVVYLLDGTPDDEWSLTDSRLGDIDGKWAGFRDGVDAIKTLRAEPVIRVEWPWCDREQITSTCRVEVEIDSESPPTATVWEFSGDGGLHWRRTGAGPSLVINPAHLPQTSNGLYRVHCVGSDGWSSHYRVSPFFQISAGASKDSEGT